jgi:lactate permease
MILRDSGSLYLITLQIAPLTGSLFPIISPFIGMLGTFLTGSNQSSNILFGDLQSQIASHLAINNIVIIALHSLSSGLNSAIAPAKILLGTTALNISGTENQVLKKTLPFCIIITLLLGIIGYILK